jgi:hypothetical protein
MDLLFGEGLLSEFAKYLTLSVVLYVELAEFSFTVQVL